MRSRNTRISALASVVALAGILLGSTAAEARIRCYPKCSAGDATVTAIMTRGTLQRNVRNPVTVEGANIGNRDATISMSLKTNGRRASHYRTALRVAAGDPFTVVLSSWPKKRARAATLTACARAWKDANRSNDCASASVRVA